MSDSRPPPRWMRRMISTMRWVPPWQVVQRPQDSSSRNQSKCEQRSMTQARVVHEDEAAAAEEPRLFSRKTSGSMRQVQVEGGR